MAISFFLSLLFALNLVTVATAKDATPTDTLTPGSTKLITVVKSIAALMAVAPRAAIVGAELAYVRGALAVVFCKYFMLRLFSAWVEGQFSVVIPRIPSVRQELQLPWRVLMLNAVHF